MQAFNTQLDVYLTAEADILRCVCVSLLPLLCLMLCAFVQQLSLLHATLSRRAAFVDCLLHNTSADVQPALAEQITVRWAALAKSLARVVRALGDVAQLTDALRAAVDRTSTAAGV